MEVNIYYLSTYGEEKAGGEQARGGELILHVAPAVRAVRPKYLR